jgi:hypothetical protein
MRNLPKTLAVSQPLLSLMCACLAIVFLVPGFFATLPFWLSLFMSSISILLTLLALALSNKRGLLRKAGIVTDLLDLAPAGGLLLPPTIGGDLDLSGFTSAEGLVLPQFVGGNLDLSGLIATEGLDLSKTVVNGTVILPEGF